MLTSFVLSMALAAPVPAAPAPVASGPAPRLMEIKPNADGKVLFTVIRYDTQKVQVTQANAAGGAAPAVITREVKVPKTETVELGDVKDLTVTTADGKKVDVADAAKKLKDGAVVVVSADGKPVSPNFLKAFKDDVLVLASPELAGATGGTTTPGIRPGIRPLPAPGLPAQPGVIQIQIQPGQIQIAPAVPAVPPAAAPGK